jgi:hypothetical protein
MPDLNKLITDVEKESKDIKGKLSKLFEKYEDLYRDGNRQFRTERTASAGSMDGLEEFRHLILLVKRNKDVVASLMRGIMNLKIISNFKFIEEEVEVPKPKPKKRKSSTPKTIPVEQEPIEVEEINGQ